MTDPATPVEQPERLSAERLAEIRTATAEAADLGHSVPSLMLADLLAEVSALRSTIAHLEAERDAAEFRADELTRIVGEAADEIRKHEARAAADAPIPQAAPEPFEVRQTARVEAFGHIYRIISYGGNWGDDLTIHCIIEDAPAAAALFPDPEDPPAPRPTHVRLTGRAPSAAKNAGEVHRVVRWTPVGLPVTDARPEGLYDDEWLPEDPQKDATTEEHP